MSAYDEADDFLLDALETPDRQRPPGLDPAERFYRDLIGVRPRRALRRRPSVDETWETVPGAAPAPIALPAGFRLGVWVDVGGRNLARHGTRHAALLHELGFSDACVMINRLDAAQFGFSAVSAATLRVFAALLVRGGTRLTLTSWLRPERTFIDDLVRLLPPLARDLGAQAIELDVEGAWRSRPVRGFANHGEAAGYLFDALRPAAAGLELAVTCEVDPMTTARMRPVVERADLLVPQAYSVGGSDAAHRIGGAYGPGGIQERAVAKVNEAVRASGRPILIGLAAYHRGAWRGTSEPAVMRMELERALALRASASIRGVRYWSWKHIAGFDGAAGSPANRYGLRFFRESVTSGGPAAAWSAAPAAAPPAPPAAAPSSAAGRADAPAEYWDADGAIEYADRDGGEDDPGESWDPAGAEDEAAGFEDDPADDRRSWDASADPLAERPETRLPSPDCAFDAEWDLRSADALQSAADDGEAALPAARAAAPRVLHTVRIDLPLTRGRIEAAKLYDPASDTVRVRAVDPRGAAVALEARLAAEQSAWRARHRQIHPALARAMDRLSAEQWVPILVWLFHEHALPRKDERAQTPLLVAAREGETLVAAPPPAADPEQDRYTAALRESVGQVQARARAEIQTLGVEVTGGLPSVPVLIAQATRAQVEALSRLPQVTGLYLHEPDGILDVANAIADARAATAHAAGFRGANVRLAVWEETPRSAADLAIEGTYDAAAAAGQSADNRDHAQLVTAVVKNTQASGPRGFAPDARIYSANTFEVAALSWAVLAERCTVVNQSFHRASEETDPGLSADDLIKDYLALRPPFPTIVQAAGNGPATEYVNHKGYNGVTVGNHEDGARRMRSTSVFRNPSSAHGDRELPDLAANGTTVSATGLSMSGTSFSSPAVAGSVAAIQSVDVALRSWPEGCRAILLASASRNIVGGSWREAAFSPSVDGIDGSGALDTGEAAKIARQRAARGGRAAQRGWDVGMLRTEDLESNGNARWSYRVEVPSSGARRLKAALAWSGKVVYTEDTSLAPPVKVTESKLTADLDLHVYLGTSLVAHSSTFDNSFEIVEFDARAGQTYDVRIRRFSGTDWVWFGLAWTLL